MYFGLQPCIKNFLSANSFLKEFRQRKNFPSKKIFPQLCPKPPPHDLSDTPYTLVCLSSISVSQFVFRAPKRKNSERSIYNILEILLFRIFRSRRHVAMTLTAFECSQYEFNRPLTRVVAWPLLMSDSKSFFIHFPIFLRFEIQFSCGVSKRDYRENNKQKKIVSRHLFAWSRTVNHSPECSLLIVVNKAPSW